MSMVTMRRLILVLLSLNFIPVITCAFVIVFFIFLLANVRVSGGLLSYLIPAGIIFSAGIIISHLIWHHTLPIVIMKYMATLEISITTILSLVTASVFLSYYEEGVNKSKEFTLFIDCIEGCNPDDIQKIRQMYFDKNPELKTVGKRVQNIVRVANVMVLLLWISVIILTIIG